MKTAVLASTLAATGLAAAAFLATPPAQAIVITSTLPEFNYDGDPPFPSPSQVVGTFSYLIPSGETITSASLSGTFGNSTIVNTASVLLKVDNIPVAECLQSELCTSAGTPTPWSYSFLPSEFSLLNDGSAELTSIQNAEFITRLGQTTLTIQTSPGSSVPGPLPVVGASVAYGFSRKLRKRIRISSQP